MTLRDGRIVAREGNLGPPVDPALTTRVVEFNDLAALEAALAHGDVACVLAEPALTNVGIVHPEPGFHAALRELTRRAGTLLIIDETHTICAGPGGYTRAHGLEPDILTLGQAGRRRRAGRRVRAERRGGRAGRARSRLERRTRAASAARSPPTPWPRLRCEPRSSTC